MELVLGFLGRDVGDVGFRRKASQRELRAVRIFICAGGKYMGFLLSVFPRVSIRLVLASSPFRKIMYFFVFY